MPAPRLKSQPEGRVLRQEPTHAYETPYSTPRREPVLFRHHRPGISGRPFVLLKFRTMTDARYPDSELLPDERRIAQFGQMLWIQAFDLNQVGLLGTVKAWLVAGVLD